MGHRRVEARVAGRTVVVRGPLALALALAEIPAPVRAAAPELPRDEPPPARGPVEVESAGLPPELVAPPVAVLGEARRLEAALRFADAARIHEEQWRATGDPRFLYHAAVLRARAGQHAVALRHLVECIGAFIARGEGRISEALRRHLEDARQREFEATTPTRLRLVEPTAGGLRPVPAALLDRARLVVRASGLPGEHVHGNSFEIVGPVPGELRLDPGAWIVQLELPGFSSVEVERSIGPGPTEWEIVVQRRELVVDLRFTPARALRRARLRMRATDHDSLLAFEHDLRAPTATVTLTPGPWRLEVAARRHEAAMDLTIAPGQPAIAVTLHERPSGDDKRLRRDKKLVIGILVPFAAAFYTGMGLMLGAANRDGRIEERDAAAHEAAGLDPKMPGMIDPAAQAMIEAAYPTAQYHRDVAAMTRLHTAGIVIAGVSIGAAAAVAPVAAGARRRVAFIELGAGAALLGGGAAWLAWSLDRRADLLDDPARRVTAEQLDRGDGHRIAASMFTGAGLGLVLFTGVVLATDAAGRDRRARSFGAAPLAAPGLAGLSLRGRF